MKNFLISTLELEETDVYQIFGPLDLTRFMNFACSEEFSHLEHPPFIPQQPLDINPELDIFDQVRQHDVFLHHPYESFDPVINLINQAVDDPKVLAIKQTLYRVGGKSPIVAALARAGEMVSK